ncbi:hypothetical protein ACGFNU_17915 [Spirillospora sp. NPDC048911]|uniref:hypothetical protein n=1 Tax=Spirillospora sp. NPDC048911 TaxID=3364527 RepID=UPI003714FA41
MFSWHASVEGPDATFAQPLQTVDLSFLGGRLPPEVHVDLDECLRASLQAAENKLRPGQGSSMLTPVGVSLSASGSLNVLADYEVDFAYDDEAVDKALNNMFGEILAEAADLRCMALNYYVRMKDPTDGGGPQDVSMRRSTDWQDRTAQTPPGAVEAVTVDLEHRAGVAFAIFMPYAWQRSALIVGDLIAAPTRRQVWS